MPLHCQERPKSRHHILEQWQDPRLAFLCADLRVCSSEGGGQACAGQGWAWHHPGAAARWSTTSPIDIAGPSTITFVFIPARSTFALDTTWPVARCR